MFTLPKISLSGERIFISFSPVLSSKKSVTNFDRSAIFSSIVNIKYDYLSFLNDLSAYLLDL